MLQLKKVEQPQQQETATVRRNWVTGWRDM
jgi:ribosome modulation factor